MIGVHLEAVDEVRLSRQRHVGRPERGRRHKAALEPRHAAGVTGIALQGVAVRAGAALGARRGWTRLHEPWQPRLYLRAC